MSKLLLKLMGPLTLAAVLGCGTIVGNGNQCKEVDCDKQTSTNRKETAVEGKTPSSPQSPTQNKSVDDDRDTDIGRSQESDTGAQPESATSGANTADVDWQTYVAAIFDPCSALFDLDLPSTLRLEASGFKNGALQLVIRMSPASGDATFTSGAQTTATFTKDTNAVCTKRTHSIATEGSLEVQNHNWIDSSGNSIVMIVKFESGSTPKDISSITVTINSLERLILVK